MVRPKPWRADALCQRCGAKYHVIERPTTIIKGEYSPPRTRTIKERVLCVSCRGQYACRHTSQCCVCYNKDYK